MAERILCSIEDCCKPAKKRGWCETHYSRWRRANGPVVVRYNAKGTHKCKIAECSSPAETRGWCIKHYGRWYDHGDPLYCAKTENGAAMNFFQTVALPFTGQECLIWPFPNQGTYGNLHIKGIGKQNVHRLVCEARNGPAPSRRHLAAHSCGNRTCCNPNHLRWATPRENQLDRVAHGTHSRGERSAKKLTENDVRAIRGMLGTTTKRAIAELFGITAQAVYRIETKKMWGWLD